MKTLSIKQPWAHLIASGIKDIENRTWRTNFRGKIHIHVSGKPISRENLYDVLNEKQWDFVFQMDLLNKYDPDNIYYSAIIGEVEIIDCVINHPSIWAEKTPMNHYPIPKDKKIYNW